MNDYDADQLTRLLQLSLDQHDDHIWLTYDGEAWAIHAIDSDIFELWQGYWPDLRYLTVYWPRQDHPGYANAAAVLLWRREREANRDR